MVYLKLVLHMVLEELFEAAWSISEIRRHSVAPNTKYAQGNGGKLCIPRSTAEMLSMSFIASRSGKSFE